MIELWVVAFILLVFVVLVYSILSGTLLKPIADLSDDLAVDIHNPDSQPLDLHGKGMLFKSNEMLSLVAAYNDMKEIIRARDDELNQINQKLEEKVKQRTAELEASNQELKTFNYSVSHDLRSPLRGIDGLSKILLEDYEDRLDDTARDYLHRIRKGTQRMGDLIDDMLNLSAVSAKDIKKEQVNLSAMVGNIIDVHREQEPERKTVIKIKPDIFADGDIQLLQIALENLIGNAWKYSSKQDRTVIEFGSMQQHGRNIFFVRDQGAGFDMSYADKLFGVFERLHGNDYNGTGIGLATVKRIIERHHGEVWAESEINQGSTFYFTLG